MLAKLYLEAYPPGVAASDLAEARAEMDSTFSDEFGVLRREASLVACVDGEPAGAIFTVDQSIWDEGLTGPFIIDLFVRTDARGRGAGKALINAAITACMIAADETISLRVGGGTSVSAHRLYEQLGFVDPYA